MKRLLAAIPLLVGTALSAQTTYYVAAAGGSNGNSGSSGSPWATLAHAVSAVSAGDTIFMQPGVHTIATPVDVPVGVNLTGGGNTSVINCTNTAEWNWCRAFEYVPPPSPTLSITNASATEGDASGSTMTFQVQLTTPPSPSPAARKHRGCALEP